MCMCMKCLVGKQLNILNILGASAIQCNCIRRLFTCSYIHTQSTLVMDKVLSVSKAAEGEQNLFF